MFPEAPSAIQEELHRHERLLWAGQPPQGVRLHAADAFMIPFSIMWGGFAIFWEAMVIVMGAGLFFMAWGVPFVLIGLYLMLGRFWVDARQRAETYYALTDSRVIIISGVFSRSTRSLNVRTLSDVSLTKKRNGSGTISFGPINPMFAWWGFAGWPGMGRYAPSSRTGRQRRRSLREDSGRPEIGRGWRMRLPQIRLEQAAHAEQPHDPPSADQPGGGRLGRAVGGRHYGIQRKGSS